MKKNCQDISNILILKIILSTYFRIMLAIKTNNNNKKKYTEKKINISTSKGYIL